MTLSLLNLQLSEGGDQFDIFTLCEPLLQGKQVRVFICLLVIMGLTISFLP